MIIAATAHSIRNAVTQARRVANLSLKESREVFRAGGGDGLYRVYLTNGVIVEVTIRPHAVSEAYVVSEGWE